MSSALYRGWGRDGFSRFSCRKLPQYDKGPSSEYVEDMKQVGVLAHLCDLAVHDGQYLVENYSKAEPAALNKSRAPSPGPSMVARLKFALECS